MNQYAGARCRNRACGPKYNTRILKKAWIVYCNEISFRSAVQLMNLENKIMDRSLFLGVWLWKCMIKSARNVYCVHWNGSMLILKISQNHRSVLRMYSTRRMFGCLLLRWAESRSFGGALLYWCTTSFDCWRSLWHIAPLILAISSVDLGPETCHDILPTRNHALKNTDSCTRIFFQLYHPGHLFPQMIIPGAS